MIIMVKKLNLISYNFILFFLIEILSNDCVEGLTLSMTRIIEGGKMRRKKMFLFSPCTYLTTSFDFYVHLDTYPISDNESATDSVYIIDTNIVKLQPNDEEQGELNRK